MLLFRLGCCGGGALWWCSVVVVPFVGVVVVMLSTGAPAGIHVAELMPPVSTTTFCPCLLQTRRLFKHHVSPRKVSLSLWMPLYFPWTAPCMLA
jgi:hypothetical protein